MFSKKKDNGPSRSGKGKALAAQLGVYGNMEAMEDDIYGDEDDTELEKELMELTRETQKEMQSKSRKTEPKSSQKVPAHLQDLDNMIAASLRDIPSDEEVSDTEDPDLLSELQALEEDDEDSYEPPTKTSSPPTLPTSGPPKSAPVTDKGDGVTQELLNSRLKQYQEAHANAKAAGDSSKARRIDRGIKALQDLLKKASAGRSVSADDVPPEVATSASKPSPPQEPSSPAKVQTLVETNVEKSTTPASSPSSQTSNQRISQPSHLPGDTKQGTSQPPSHLSEDKKATWLMLHTRQNQYKEAAVDAKHKNDKVKAAQYFKTYKQFEAVLSALERNEEIDLSQMPLPPPGYAGPAGQTTQERTQASSNVAEEMPPEISTEDKKKLFHAPTKADTVEEALQQRITKYQQGAQSAEQEGNTSKMKRMKRIVTQYQTAIKDYKAGRPVNFDELPTPPGFPPIPVAGAGAAEAKPSPQPTPKPTPKPSSTTPAASSSSQHVPKKLNRQTSSLSRAEQQALFLEERSLQYKKAALIAKQEGKMELAKKYLRVVKGLTPMIEASHSGLPVDLTQVPPALGSVGANTKLEFMPREGQVTGDREEMYKKLQQDLIQQIRTCTTNADHFTKLGDVTSASRLDKLLIAARKDLDSLKNAYKHGDPVPRFHYETKTFTLVQSNPDLGDSDVEVNVIRGINLALPSGFQPKDLDTYVQIEFPFPKEDPKKADSSTVKHTNSPEYNFTTKFQGERKSRTYLRVVNTKVIKMDVYYRRGFLKGDKVLGSVTIKLQPLESTCSIHDSFDLYDGRKAVGGKLEVKVRIRQPYMGKQVEETTEKWLVIDAFERAMPSSQSSGTAAKEAKRSAPPPPPQAAAHSKEPQAPKKEYDSLEVLKYEKQLLEQQIKKYQGKLTAAEKDALELKGNLIEKTIAETKSKISSQGKDGLKEYISSINKLTSVYQQEAKSLALEGNRDKAQIMLTKKKLVEKEVEHFSARLTTS